MLAVEDMHPAGGRPAAKGILQAVWGNLAVKDKLVGRDKQAVGGIQRALKGNQVVRGIQMGRLAVGGIQSLGMAVQNLRTKVACKDMRCRLSGFIIKEILDNLQ